MKKEKTLREHLSEAGQVRSNKKAASSRENGLDQRPHVKKVKHFLSVFPGRLEDNEWKKKFLTGALTKTGRKETCNPDFYYPEKGQYIEVATSKPNISISRRKWRALRKRGVPLRIYWWEGQDITDEI